MSSDQSARLQRLLDVEEIRALLHRYCQGVDRRQWDVIRSVYWPDAWDDHGDFRGNLDDFIAMCQVGLARYERTMHFIGTTNVDVDGDRARSEAYTIAYHRLSPKGDRPARDHVVGFRYLDDLERRDGEWRIAFRLCSFDWTRTDPVPPGWEFTPPFHRGVDGAADAVFAPRLVDVDRSPHF